MALDALKASQRLSPAQTMMLDKRLTTSSYKAYCRYSMTDKQVFGIAVHRLALRRF